MSKDYDFVGWATKNDLQCEDGRVIRRNAFADQDGCTVPLVWNHDHNDPDNVLGHALLKNTADGVRAFLKINMNSKKGPQCKSLIENGDVNALSIYANKLRQKASDVLHGKIRELSLCLAGSNPGAFIDDQVFAHGDADDGEAIIYMSDLLELYHSDDEDEKKKKPESEEKKEEPKVEGDEKKKEEEKKEPEEKEAKTLQQVFDTLNDEQKEAVYVIAGKIAKDSKNNKSDDDDEEEDKKEMKHNVFNNDQANNNANVICHSDQEQILALAKNSSVGTFKNALGIYAEDHEDVLQHDATSGGFTPATVGLLFPEYKDVRPGAPELIINDQGWVTTVMNKVHKSPISRVRTQQVDIRNIEALRAKGYQKGKQKALAGNFALVRRTTDPQTVYVKNALHKDDITDITDFDYVQYLYNIDKLMLNEELATAIMFGDGREDGDPDKIYPEHIRPIYLDDELYTIHKTFDLTEIKKDFIGSAVQEFGENYMYAEGMVNTVLYARENYKGTGTPDAFVTPHMLNKMLLARDLNGRRIYSSKAELAAALNVGDIYTIEQMANKRRTVTIESVEHTMKPICIIANLGDYTVGATKGGEVSHFTQFDIDFNQEKSLIETRCSGTLTRVYSAIAIEEEVTTP